MTNIIPILIVLKQRRQRDHELEEKQKNNYLERGL